MLLPFRQNWQVLTGDRMETAINVSMSAGHIYPQTVQLYATGLREEESCKVCDSVANLRSTLKTVLSFLCLALFNRPFLFFFPHTHTLSLPLFFFLYIINSHLFFAQAALADHLNFIERQRLIPDAERRGRGGTHYGAMSDSPNHKV